MNYQVMPELTPDEYSELKNDIAERGVMVPIEFDEAGNILDGYNRYQICQELGLIDQNGKIKNDENGNPLVPSVIRAGMTEEEKYTHARKLNLARRHLNREQWRQLIREQIIATPEKTDRQIAGALGVSPTTVGTIRHELEASGDVSKLDTSIDTLGREQPRQRKPVTVFNPSNRDAEALKDPDIVRRVAETGSNVAGAIREQKRDQLVEHLEAVETKEAKAVAGVYDVIVIDPPWPMQKIETDRRPLEVNMDYPVMSLDEIKQLEIPAADNCHIFLWTTQKFLPDAFDVLKTWGVKYVCTFVWHKVGGYKPLDLPRYNCEFCLYAHKGSPRFIDDHQFWLCNDWPVNGHSVKPEEFYEMLRRVTAGRRLDMFNRRKIDGFDSWGKEAADD